jgi:pilus assembly protein CpaF
VTDPGGLVARYRDRIRREVLEHGVTGADPRAALAARTRALLRSEVALPPGDLDRLVEAMLDDALGAGPLEPLMRDPDVTEVIANGPDHVYAERRGLLRREQVRGRGAPAPRDRADRDRGRPARRRVQSDGRRAAARR